MKTLNKWKYVPDLNYFSVGNKGMYFKEKINATIQSHLIIIEIDGTLCVCVCMYPAHYPLSCFLFCICFFCCLFF